jgi:hypothetical protein
MENPVQPIVACLLILLAATPLHRKKPAFADFAGAGEHSYGLGTIFT